MPMADVTDGDRLALAELVKNAAQIMLFLPHLQVNLWGGKKLTEPIFIGRFE